MKDNSQFVVKSEHGLKAELEYYALIEEFGGFIWRMSHDLHNGRIKDADGTLGKDISDVQTLFSQLTQEVSEKFGVILPKDYPEVAEGLELPLAPDGKIYYRDWYKKMQVEVFTAEYEKMICSACPFSEGVEKMISLGGRVPCSVSLGVINQLRPAYHCAMVEFSYWTQHRLYNEIIRKADEEVAEAFKQKETALIEAAKAGKAS